MSTVLRQFRGRFLRHNDGSVAVEFSMVAIPLLLILFSILEMSMVYVVSGTLEAAVAASSRTIRTGQVQKGDVTKEQFKSAICSNLAWLGSQCLSNLLVDVRTSANFINPGMAPPLQNGELDQNQMQWNPGSQGEIVLVRAYYKWPLLTPWATGLERTASGAAVVTAATTFRNEPF